MTSHTLRPLLPGLIPLALSACMNASPAQANPSTNSSPMGVDLGNPAAPSPMGPMGAGHETRRMGKIQMAHKGHVHAQASGTVNSVDAGAHKINISHGPIRDLGWQPMTTDFPVEPSVNLKSIKLRSRVKFTLEKGEDGMPVVQSINPTKAGE